MKNEWVIKICSAGSYQVGKTSLIRRYAEGKFESEYTPTIGVDITTKNLVIDKQAIKLLLMDTAGQEIFGKIRPAYYEGALGCMIVYDITRRETFEALDGWIEEFRSVTGDKTSISIVGNKNDLEELRAVKRKEGEEFAKARNIPFYECSAKLGGEIIESIYSDLVRRYLKYLEEKKERI
ncbi:MAG: Rab family GTPase [Candidatus Hodarchaeales archaeon]